MKWNCNGIQESITKIENFLATSKRRDKSFVACKSLKELENTITSLMSDKDNDENYLLSYRRQVRMLIRKVTV